MLELPCTFKTGVVHTVSGRVKKRKQYFDDTACTFFDHPIAKATASSAVPVAVKLCRGHIGTFEILFLSTKHSIQSQ